MEEEEEGEEVGEGMKDGIQNEGEFFKFAISKNCESRTRVNEKGISSIAGKYVD